MGGYLLSYICRNLFLHVCLLVYSSRDMQYSIKTIGGPLVLKPWEIHGKTIEKHGENSMDSLENHGAWSWSKIPWFPWGNIHAFHASMEQENCASILHESMESMEYKTMETMESM